MKYQVLDSGKPCDHLNHEVDKSWNKSTHDTFEEARSYAWKWLGWHGGSIDGKTGYPLKLNVPWDYSGMGTFIEIKLVE